MDLSKLSDSDLDALESGNIRMMSDEGLSLVENSIVYRGKPNKTLSTFERFRHGLSEPLSGAAQMLEKSVPAGVSDFVNKVDNMLYDSTHGLFGQPHESFSKRLEEEGAAIKAGSPEGFDWGRMAGNIVGTAPMPLGGANTLPRAVGAGVVAGTLNPVYDPNDSFLGSKVEQGAIGGLTAGVLHGAGRAVLPHVQLGDDVKMLQGQGVNPTIGQALGGAANTLEQKATSLPIMGDAIRSARERGRNQFNEATINKAATELGEALPPNTGKRIGTAGVDTAHENVSSAYDKAFQLLKDVDWDDIGTNQLDNLMQTTGAMAPKAQKQLNRVIKDVVSDKGNLDEINWVKFQRIDSDLNEIATRYKSSSLASEKEVGIAIDKYRKVIQEQVSRANPEFAEALKKANAGFAKLATIEEASKRAALKDGIFTPGQLLGAIRQQDRSARKHMMARGQADMQPWATAGQKVLGDTYPDSGTAGRMLAGGVGLASGMVDPVIPVGLIAGAGAYTPAMQQMIVKYIQSGHSAFDAARLAAQALDMATVPGITREITED